jgi:hypothetical protein
VGESPAKDPVPHTAILRSHQQRLAQRAGERILVSLSKLEPVFRIRDPISDMPSDLLDHPVWK